MPLEVYRHVTFPRGMAEAEGADLAEDSLMPER
jgi:hypothetical protein